MPTSTTGASSDAASADWGEEKIFYEGPPSYGDLATNLALGFTLLWLVRSVTGPVVTQVQTDLL